MAIRILALDTSTRCCSAALLSGDTLECEINLHVRQGHAGELLPLIDSLFRHSDTGPSDLSLIASGIGPGSFTGIRIGIATAKGLSMALGCPLAGISTLDTLAYGALPSRLPVMPLIDARKTEVYFALYSPDGYRLTEYLNRGPDEVKNYITEPTLFIGDGLELYRDMLAEDLGEHFVPGTENLWTPRAYVTGLLARKLPIETLTKDISPLYVRQSDADLILAREKSQRL
ncbi:MAG TPA: tRNA (adenosine(37)-N6)-threonylcarbamoyltransferase complex dimerization subunit type 1 TsaB [Deltaproteobacteria bacterium]|nr:tRNA (adenosine(37)-N6)-threonylcarbamoyltransferase complex dimerization subunit type 1 TsaB [Deltaproteobacteria bacterium]